MRLNIFLFLFIFILWNVMGCLSVYLVKFLSMIGIISFELSYPLLYKAILFQLLFLCFVVISFYFFSRKKKKQVAIIHTVLKKSNYKFNFILLVIIFINNIVIIFKNGIILFQGDYQSRFEMEASVIQKIYIPFICWGIFILNIYQSQFSLKLLIKKYGLFIFLCLVTSILNSTRGFAFFSVISLGWYSLYYLKVKINLILVIRFFLGFIIVYFGGQLINIFRTYGADFNLIEMIRTFSEDSFNEIRSFATILYDREIYTLDTNPLTYFNDFIARLFPSFVYKILGLNRMDYWNGAWESISSYIWGTNDALYGLRFGLVGEISIYLGELFIIIFGILYGRLLALNNKYSILIITYLIFTIPYGMLSFIYLIYTIIIYKLFKILKLM